MTPAVTASALMRFAMFEISISTRIGYAPEEKAGAARNMLNCINEWAIDFHFNWWRVRRSKSGRSHHCHRSGRGRFGSLFIHGDKGFVKDLRDIEVIVGLSRRHPVEIGAPLRLIEGRLHPERLQLFRKRHGRRLKLEFWQMKLDVALFQLCALC